MREYLLADQLLLLQGRIHKLVKKLEKLKEILRYKINMHLQQVLVFFINICGTMQRARI